MKNSLFLFLLFAFCFSSCIKEDVPPCHDQYKVQLYVKDKNYINQHTVSETLSFRQYINGLYYVLHNVVTGDNIYGQYSIIESEEENYTLPFSNIPNGRYILHVWGNLVSNRIIENMRINLHSDHQESTDIYFVADTLDFTSDRQSAVLGLERTKGKLQITLKNFPDSITKIDILVSNLYENKEFYLYSGSTEITKSFLLTNKTDYMYSVFLAPTVQDVKSKLNLSIFGNNGDVPLFIPAAIDMIIKRNEITNIEINHNDLNRVWEIWIQIDGEWEMVYQLEIS